MALDYAQLRRAGYCLPPEDRMTDQQRAQLERVERERAQVPTRPVPPPPDVRASLGGRDPLAGQSARSIAVFRQAAGEELADRLDVRPPRQSVGDMTRQIAAENQVDPALAAKLLGDAQLYGRPGMRRSVPPPSWETPTVPAWNPPPTPRTASHAASGSTPTETVQLGAWSSDAARRAGERLGVRPPLTEAQEALVEEVAARCDLDAEERATARRLLGDRLLTRSRRAAGR